MRLVGAAEAEGRAEGKDRVKQPMSASTCQYSWVHLIIKMKDQRAPESCQISPLFTASCKSAWPDLALVWKRITITQPWRGSREQNKRLSGGVVNRRGNMLI